jgi:hypothetical protein
MALVVTRLGVGVAIDDLDRPLGVLELYLLIIALVGNLLLVFPLAGRHAVTTRLLLLLLMELCHELLDLPALLGAVVPRVVHRAPRPALIAVGGLALLLLPIHVLATALSSGIYFRLTGLPYLRSRLGVPCTPFCSPDALVRQAEELRDIFHLMGGQLLEHLLISHAMSKSNYNISIGDVGDGVLNLGEPLDEGPQ